ncbi:MAG: alpha/beta hydrolase [Actinomycetota bacterium]
MEDAGPGPVVATVEVGECRLRTATWGSAEVPGPAPDVVMLHDGLGSIRQWRETPALLAARTGLTVTAYERAGHGASTPVPTGGWPADWLHREAVVLGGVLDAVGASDPVLVGHSDGGSIAAIHAATTPTASPLVLLAAHSWVEHLTSSSIAAMRESSEQYVAGLAKSHDDPSAVFDAWSIVWTSDAFATWDIRPMLSGVGAPTLVVQGDRDEYASSEHAFATARAIGDNAQVELVAGLGHLLHHEDAVRVVEVVADFVLQTIDER